MTPESTNVSIGSNGSDPDAQAPRTGKVENDRNKAGQQEPTQKNQPKRSPQSRNDRESQLGSSNQSQSRRGVTGR